MADLARLADTLALMLALGASASAAAWVARKRWWGYEAVAIVLAKFVRWGWAVFLTACLLPRCATRTGGAPSISS